MIRTINLSPGFIPVPAPEIECNLTIFPGGEVNPSLNPRVEYNDVDLVIITTRIITSQDFMVLLNVKNALDQLYNKEVHLILPYVPYARQDRVCNPGEALSIKGFASTNIVFGVGSYSMGYATRDNQGGAVKSTYVEINGEGHDIFKDPITDDGTKKSAKGLLCVLNIDDVLVLRDQCERELEELGLLKEVYVDGDFKKSTTLAEIRSKIKC